jgi:hypothetical protein
LRLSEVTAASWSSRICFVQQPPDQRALAVVHAAAGDEAQQFLRLVAAQEFRKLRRGHQK